MRLCPRCAILLRPDGMCCHACGWTGAVPLSCDSQDNVSTQPAPPTGPPTFLEPVRIPDLLSPWAKRAALAGFLIGFPIPVALGLLCILFAVVGVASGDAWWGRALFNGCGFILAGFVLGCLCSSGLACLAFSVEYILKGPRRAHGFQGTRSVLNTAVVPARSPETSTGNASSPANGIQARAGES
jgi:hypothetical protein